jgi:hypothetical protein
MLRTLHVARKKELLIDAGGFFGDSGYHQLGQGEAESQILSRLYDLVLPTVPGFRHYLTATEVRGKCVLTNLTRTDGSGVFPRSAAVRVGMRETLVLGVIGREQFAAIPAADRAGAVWHPPADAIRAHAHRALSSRRVALLVLSCCGEAETRQIARTWVQNACVIITSGSGMITPSPAHAAAVSPPADGAGYSRLVPVPGGGWQADAHRFPATLRGPQAVQMQDLHALLQGMTSALTAPPIPGTNDDADGPPR